MDRPERTQAAGDASRRQGIPGATPEPEQAVFRGRQVAEVPAAGPSPSRTEPQTTRECAAVGASPGGPIVRRAGRAGRSFQPYTAGEPGRWPGASPLPAGEPSVPPVPQGGRQEPERLVRFNWNPVYSDMGTQRIAEAERADTYAAAASDAALREIDRAVMEAYCTHIVRSGQRAPQSTPDALDALRKARAKAKRSGNLNRTEAVQRSLEQIYGLTRAKSRELKDRRAEFQSVSLSRAVPVPGREALGGWLQAQADAAPGPDIEHSYFTQLAQELHHRRDPWTVSRELMGSLPSPGDAQQAGRLRAAHERLVRAIACGLSEQRSDSGSPQPLSYFSWRTVYRTIQARCSLDRSGSDIYAAIASISALRDIDRAVMDAYFAHRLHGPLVPPSDSTVAMQKIRSMRSNAVRVANQPRFEAIQRSLDAIHRLTHAHHTELGLRSWEFRSASLPRAAPVPCRETLEWWLWAQAHAAPGTGIEHSYFVRLAQQLHDERDPWTVSREFIGSLPRPDNAGDAARLQTAHLRLVQAMAGNPSPQAAVPTPIVTQASGESRASVSMQQGIAEQLNSRKPLSGWQVKVIMSAVGRAIDAGKLGVSTSRPEAWVRDLVGRVQISVQRPFGDLTESEGELESSDLKRLGELAEQLGGMGYL